MLKRKIYDELLKWKKNKVEECLLIKGPRQCGKTYIIKEFGKREYKSFIYLNFIENPKMKDIFSDSLTAEDIYKKMSYFIPGVKFIEKNTLICLDEIEECANARTALKFLAIDNKYDVIATGSLLGLHYKEIKSIPVGYEKHINMYPLDFEEFLWGLGQSEESIELLKEQFRKKVKIEDSINDYFLNRFKEYMVIGGFPEVVCTFIAKNNYYEAFLVQQKILDSFYYDIEKYSNNVEKGKIKLCFDSIPKQLSKEYTKFQYKVIEKNASSRKYENSLNWLLDAGLIKFCYNVSAPLFPLKGYEIINEFKIYLTDIGLLTAMYGFSLKQAILDNKLVGAIKGGIYESTIADILIKKDINLHYFKNSNSTQEIEFLIDDEAFVLPIEVKASNNKSISLDNYILKYKPQKAYKYIYGNIGNANDKLTLPLYMSIFL